MKKAKNALKRFWTRASGLVRRGGGGDGGENEKSPKDRNGGALWRLIPLACGLAVSVFVFASLTQCEYWQYDFPLLGSTWCELSSRTFGFMSISGGAGFLIFLTMEVARMIFAQMWRDRQIDIKDREIDRAERRAEAAERMAEAAERRAELAEQARREDAERAERREEAAERRELLLIELIASLKNGRDDANGKDDGSE